MGIAATAFAGHARGADARLDRGPHVLVFLGASASADVAVGCVPDPKGVCSSLESMSQSIFVVDAFADRPFAGNPAAVCLLNQPAQEPWMQLVAREMNHSETAFLSPEGGCFRLRWFTPTVEVDLCGHATLASAHVLWESGQLAPSATAHFLTRSGPLTAHRDGERTVLDFPALRAEACEPMPELVAALGAPACYTGKNRFDYLVEVANESAVRSLQPDFERLTRLPIRGVMVTSRSDDPAFDFVSRFFAPGSGIREDPVTGSAHCCLGPYWGDRLGKSELVGHQVSARGGVVQVDLRGDRVRLGGRAITVLRGELLA
jgi:PhzF family phenazine biosynthesis protein